MSFTLEHDDGLGQDGLGEADIVLAGVSRTARPPTSIYLAMLGFRVANISLAALVEPPRQLLDLAPGKTVGLIIDPRQLAEIRMCETDGMAYYRNRTTTIREASRRKSNGAGGCLRSCDVPFWM